MTGPADHPFKGPRMAFRAIYIHLFVGIDKKFFKDMTALKASEFKDRHSFSPKNNQSSHVRPALRNWQNQGKTTP
jgi:hypothetical protein